MKRVLATLFVLAAAGWSGAAVAAQGGPVTLTATASVTILPATIADPQAVARRADVTRHVSASAVVIDFQ